MFLILLVLSLPFLGYVNKFIPFAFLTGGFFSALAGFIGMRTATMANSRTASAAKEGLNKGLRVAFSAGSVMGFVVVGLGLFDLSLWYFFLRFWYTAVEGLKNEALIINVIVLIDNIDIQHYIKQFGMKMIILCVGVCKIVKKI